MRATIARLRLRRAAVRLADHRWDVLRGACWATDRYRCGPGCATVSCHPAYTHGEALLWPLEATRDAGTAAAWWQEQPHTVLLATGGALDVLEIPAYLGRPTGSDARGPVAATGTGRYLLMVAPGGALREELAALPEVVLHGAGSWVQVPPATAPHDGVRWIVSPEEVDWRLPAPAVVQGELARSLPRLREVPRPGRRALRQAA
ncbi:MAG TPA: bifunctional DNA primase/polymerase [Rugosimonospora sp.]|nr:bifunctional DNA primase/polymerase [Rugosimonospora sp.]